MNIRYYQWGKRVRKEQFSAVWLALNLQSVISHLIGWREQLGLSDRSQGGYRCPGRCMLGNNCSGILALGARGVPWRQTPIFMTSGPLDKPNTHFISRSPLSVSLCRFIYCAFPSSLCGSTRATFTRGETQANLLAPWNAENLIPIYAQLCQWESSITCKAYL